MIKNFKESTTKRNPNFNNDCPLSIPCKFCRSSDKNFQDGHIWRTCMNGF